MGKPWSNFKLGLSMNLCEQIAQVRKQTGDKKEKRTEDTPRERGVQIQLRTSAQ